MARFFITTLAFLTFMGLAPALAGDETATDNSGSSLLIPRFVTLGTDEVNLRTGPGIRYPIRFIFKKEGLPVEVIREFDVWRQIRNVDGDEGWVHKSMLSGKRSVIIKGHIRTLLNKAKEGARPVVRLEPGVIAGLDTCKGNWCLLDIASYEGWIQKEAVWGVYPDEKFKE